MKSTLSLGIISALLVIIIPEVQAQPVPIEELRRNSGIRIQGKIRSIVGNDFILSDGTGEIIVDAGPRWYHQLNLRQGETITVVGEFDDYDFDAYQITRNSGETIRIRDFQGPPPWAGGPHQRDR